MLCGGKTMITPNETMFIILGTLLINGLLIVYAGSLLSNRIRRLEKQTLEEKQ